MVNKNKETRMDIAVTHKVTLSEIKRAFKNNKRVSSSGSHKNSICASQQCIQIHGAKLGRFKGRNRQFIIIG